MQQIYHVLKSFVDPVFVIFVLLLISFLICLLSSKKKSGALLLFLMIVLLYGFSIQPVCSYLSYKLEKNYIGNLPAEGKLTVDVIVVLSGGTYRIDALDKMFPGKFTLTRLVHAIRMFKAYDAKYLVCSGKGQGKTSDAEMMAQMAHEFGVPKEKIRIEAKSTNTYEHAVELNKMFVDKNIRIGLVTSASHMRRSEAQFRKFFGKVTPLPSDYLYASPMGTPAVRYVPQSEWLFYNALIFKEHVGRFWYSIKDI